MIPPFHGVDGLSWISLQIEKSSELIAFCRVSWMTSEQRKPNLSRNCCVRGKLASKALICFAFVSREGSHLILMLIQLRRIRGPHYSCSRKITRFLPALCAFCGARISLTELPLKTRLTHQTHQGLMHSVSGAKINEQPPFSASCHDQ